MYISMMWTVLFVYGIVFYTFVEMFGLYICMIVLGMFSLMTALFAIFVVPETRGKTDEEIREMMIKKSNELPSSA